MWRPANVGDIPGSTAGEDVGPQSFGIGKSIRAIGSSGSIVVVLVLPVGEFRIFGSRRFINNDTELLRTNRCLITLIKNTSGR